MKNPTLECQNYRILLIFHNSSVTKNHAKSRTAKTLYFEGSIKRNACFYPSSPLIFTSIFHENCLFFPERLPDLLFSCFFRNFTGKVGFGTSPWRPAGSQRDTKIVPTASKWLRRIAGVGSFLATWRRLASKISPKCSNYTIYCLACLSTLIR